MLEVHDLGLASWSVFGYSHWSFWSCKEHPCPLSPHLGLWRMLEVPDWVLASWSWICYGNWCLINQCPEFCLSIMILKVQRTSMSFQYSFGALEVASVFSFWYDPELLIQPWSKFLSCIEQQCPLSSDFGLWMMLEVPDWGLASWYWFGYGHWSLVHQYSEFWLPILILQVQRTSMSFKSSFWALEDAWGSLIWIWSLVFDTPMIQILALYPDFEWAKNIYVL